MQTLLPSQVVQLREVLLVRIRTMLTVMLLSGQEIKQMERDIPGRQQTDTSLLRLPLLQSLL